MTENNSDSVNQQVQATSPATAHVEENIWTSTIKAYAFLPIFTEHPKPKRRATKKIVEPIQEPVSADGSEEGEVTFLQDFVAGGAAGSASVVVGHPFDTIKVRIQTSASGTSSHVLKSLGEYGGVSSLFRGMGAPLAAASAVNACVFSSYGIASRFYDEHIIAPEAFTEHDAPHDPWQKSMVCGMFAGFTQCLIIAPMEHIKCRLQTQHGKGSADYKYKGPLQATQRILTQHGVQRLYQGWWTTILREVPCFGLYFASYDYLKDRTNSLFAKQAGINPSDPFDMNHTHAWLASMFAGGCAGCLTWALAYPVDVIKSRVQTASLDTPFSQLRMGKIGAELVRQHGVRYLYRGLGITLVRAFPVNGTIFPVYEYTLMQMSKWGE